MKIVFKTFFEVTANGLEQKLKSVISKDPFVIILMIIYADQKYRRNVGIVTSRSHGLSPQSKMNDMIVG